MKVLFLTPETLLQKQREFTKNKVAQKEKGSSLYFLFGKQITPQTVEKCVKEKKLTAIQFVGLPQLEIETLLKHLTKKFPGKVFTPTSAAKNPGVTITQKVTAAEALQVA